MGTREAPQDGYKGWGGSREEWRTRWLFCLTFVAGGCFGLWRGSGWAASCCIALWLWSRLMIAEALEYWSAETQKRL